MSDAINSLSSNRGPHDESQRSKENGVEKEKVAAYDSASLIQTLEEELYETSDFGKAYLAKSKLVAEAIDDIGFGRYQLCLLCVAGMGWFSDNAWPIATSLILPLLDELDGVHLPTNRAPYLTLAQNLGLLAGALFWSLTSDVIGRRWAFNITFFITGLFATSSGASPNFAAVAVFDALWSFGVGGNLPVDSAIFLEALPTSYQWLLTVMSIFWAFGQLIANLIGWGLLGNFSCDKTKDICLKADNQGWRYFLYTFGGLSLLMFTARFLFRLSESPRFYLARGDDARAIEVLHRIAKFNKTECSLTLEDLEYIDGLQLDGPKEEKPTHSLLLKAKISSFKMTHIRECFGSKKLAISSSMVIFTWALIGLAFPLYNAFIPYYLGTRGGAAKTLSTYETYRNSLIVSVMGIPASLLAGLLVELRIGRKGTLCISLLLTGVFLFCSTTAKTSNANLGWTCAFSFLSNIMYGVLYAYTPEIFPTKVRGTAIGLAASANRIFGVFAPIIAMFADLTTSAPIFVSGALFIVSGVLAIFFPYEPKGKSSF
ncbi:uncharacterized protein PRCAT00004382001 [Priceomyces carsonii]|uniref:uncharacterized protein n=1 Tax=Priceomyces carsonii TaxID=28549 RepID=UPI002EDA88C8|nr:unnamed protein product [Priceomyces carsonii]